MTLTETTRMWVYGCERTVGRGPDGDWRYVDACGRVRFLGEAGESVDDLRVRHAPFGAELESVDEDWLRAMDSALCLVRANH